MEKLYPIKVDVHLYITDGEQVGDVNYVMPFSRLPTDADMPEIFDKVAGALPTGFRLMTRREAFMQFIREERGYRGPDLALPPIDEGDEWHDPNTSSGLSGLHPQDDGEDEE